MLSNEFHTSFFAEVICFLLLLFFCMPFCSFCFVLMDSCWFSPFLALSLCCCRLLCFLDQKDLNLSCFPLGIVDFAASFCAGEKFFWKILVNRDVNFVYNYFHLGSEIWPVCFYEIPPGSYVYGLMPQLVENCGGTTFSCLLLGSCK